MTIRIAMWSGPRNLSTALMRSFGSRADTSTTELETVVSPIDAISGLSVSMATSSTIRSASSSVNGR